MIIIRTAVLALALVLPLFAAKPNIIVILTDDQGYGDVSCYNPQSKFKTPNIDSLAKEGMRFTAGHSPDAVCTPTRYGTLTGRYSWRTKGNLPPNTELTSGVISGYALPLIERNRMTLASMLKLNGYATAVVGKWHLGLEYVRKDPNKPQVSSTAGRPPLKTINVDFTKDIVFGPREHGFEFSFHTPSGAEGPPGFFVKNGEILSNDVYWTGNTHTGHRARGHKTDSALPRFTREAVGFITDHVAATPDKPFYLHLTPTAPHTPHVPLPEFKEKIKQQVGKAWTYGAFVLQVDWIVGRIMHVVDSLDIKDNTLIIFASDNGPETGTCNHIAGYGHHSNGYLRGYKRDTWEGGHRVPFIARWPGKVPIAVSPETVCLTDLMATFAAIVGYKLPDTVGEDSYSILPVLLGKPLTSPIKPATVVHSVNNGYALITNKWSYIDGKGSNGGNAYSSSNCLGKNTPNFGSTAPVQLFDLEDDHRQTTNKHAVLPDTVKALKALLDTYKSAARSTPLPRNDAFFDSLFETGTRFGSHRAAQQPLVRMTVTGSSIRVQGLHQYDLSLFDLSGREVVSVTSSGNRPIDIANCRRGMYIVKASSGSVTFSDKIFLTVR